MAEPCLCGGYDCPDCGPLQGSTRCEAHRCYACSECEDYFEEHGEYPTPDDPYDDTNDQEPL